MKTKNLNAVIIGSGWAAEGHVIALRKQGIRIDAICSRNEAKVKKVAEYLKIRRYSTDWKKAIKQIKPNIVSITTPAAFRKEAIEVAANNGSNLIIEKPLAINSNEAFSYYKHIKKAKIKHAYASTHCYDPGVQWLNRLLEEKAVGTLNDIEVTFSLPFFKNSTPWSWFDRLSMGGGLLNNAFTHIIGMLEKILNGTISATSGCTFTERLEAPVYDDIRDFREVLSHSESGGKTHNITEWKACDAETSFLAISKFTCNLNNQRNTIPVYVKLNSFAANASPINGWYFNCDQTTLVGRGLFSLIVSELENNEEKVLEIPEELKIGFTDLDNDEQNKWNALISNFVKDIQGNPYDPYLTVEDGYRYQKAIDAIRQNNSYTNLISV
ncbi:MAG: Gfo/Idh/MocA family oxidoreductase [Flavobacteriaceae bacterium]|nr:Gfo/Idh/MocA family oxidoreductase [Flavobacteriaceae bacterium]